MTFIARGDWNSSLVFPPLLIVSAQYWRSTPRSLIKKKTKKRKPNFPHICIRKSRSLEGSYNDLLSPRRVVQYMTKYLRISSYIKKPFATAPIWISLYMRKILFSLSVQFPCFPSTFNCFSSIFVLYSTITSRTEHWNSGQ